MVTVVTIMSLCVLFAPLGLVGKRVTRRALRSGWLHKSNAPRVLFAKLGLTTEPVESGVEASGRGTLRDMPIALTILTTPDRARGNIWIDVDLEGLVPHGVRVSSTSRSLSSPERLDASKEGFALGDELFDRAFVASGSPALTLATLTCEVRSLLLGLLGDAATRRWSEVHLEGAHLLARAALTEESQGIDALTAQIQDVAFAASRMRFTPHDLTDTLVAQANEKQSPLYRALCAREVLARVSPGSPHEVAMARLCAESTHSELQLIHYERDPDAFDDDSLFELLNAISTNHRNAEKRAWALDMLARTFGSRLIGDTSRPMFQRLRLLRAMMSTSIPQDELVALMRSVLAGAKPSERREFWAELLEQEWAGAIELLEVERSSPPDEGTRMHCVRLCGELGGDVCERFLLVELHSPFPSIQRAAVEALGRVGGRTSFAPLSALASSKSPFAPIARVSLAALAERVGQGSMGGLSVSTHNAGGDLTILEETGALTQVDD